MHIGAHIKQDAYGSSHKEYSAKWIARFISHNSWNSIAFWKSMLGWYFHFVASCIVFVCKTCLVVLAAFTFSFKLLYMPEKHIGLHPQFLLHWWWWCTIILSWFIYVCMCMQIYFFEKLKYNIERDKTIYVHQVEVGVHIMLALIISLQPSILLLVHINIIFIYTMIRMAWDNYFPSGLKESQFLGPYLTHQQQAPTPNQT